MQAQDILRLEDFELFNGIKDEEIGLLYKGMQTKNLVRGNVLHYSTSPNKFIYFLVEGAMKCVSIDGEGKELIKYLMSSGKIFGEIPLLEKVERPDAYAEALQKSVVALLDANILKKLMLENEDFRIKINQQIGTRLQLMENRLLSQSFKSVQRRLMDFIIELCKDFGKETANGYEAPNFLIHDDIAQLTVTSRQTVSTVFNELREKGLINYNSRMISIPINSPLLEDSYDIDEFIK